ncbi:MAG: hypothetical protein RBU28_05610, partial [Bacteroidales bacterium]|nr:hypothetical protein [Bacteroidales bacterium]
FLFLKILTERPVILRLVLMIEIIRFCHTVNRFFGQRISGIDTFFKPPALCSLLPAPSSQPPAPSSQLPAPSPQPPAPSPLLFPIKKGYSFLHPLLLSSID